MINIWRWHVGTVAGSGGGSVADPYHFEADPDPAKKD